MIEDEEEPPADHAYRMCNGEMCTCPCWECVEARSFEELETGLKYDQEK